MAHGLRNFSSWLADLPALGLGQGRNVAEGHGGGKLLTSSQPRYGGEGGKVLWDERVEDKMFSGKILS